MLTWNKNALRKRLSKMNRHAFFIDRRKGGDRRLEKDPCRNLPLDLYHRKRRKSTDRRAKNRTLEQDYYAFLGQPDPEQRH